MLEKLRKLGDGLSLECDRENLSPDRVVKVLLEWG